MTLAPGLTTMTGKTVVVTGGAGGIGVAIARRLGAAGMKVVLADVLAEALEEKVGELRAERVEVHGVTADVTDYESVQRLAAETIRLCGAVHVVCNNAGTGGVSEGYMWEHDVADWRWGIDVNILGEGSGGDVMDAKARSIRQRSPPDYLVDVLAAATQQPTQTHQHVGGTR